MRWLPVFVLAYIAIGIQVGISGEVRIHGAGPNLGLIVAVFVALSAPRDAALLACVLIGAMQDLATSQAPGLYALSYGLMAWFIVSLQNVVYREHPGTHAALVLVAGIANGLIIWIHGRLPGGLGGHRVSIVLLLLTAVYTTLIAIPVLIVLLRSRRVFGMQLQRRGRGMI
jgi:rod shape-determining protein MreD